jgi:Cdc6-like AAA superfamily ATPase
MAITAANLKFYQSATWSDAAGNGGDISANEITTATSQNIFPNITDAERGTGITKYKKIFLKNLNADAYNNVHAWIQANTPDTQTAVSIVAGGKTSTQGTDTAVATLTFTFAATDQVIASADCHNALAEGELIWNSTDDTNSKKQAISTISANGLTITLAGSYAGTTGAGKTATVQKISDSTFVAAVNEAAGVHLGSLLENEYRAIWIKLVVDASSDGYTDDTFTIRVSNS